MQSETKPAPNLHKHSFAALGTHWTVLSDAPQPALAALEKRAKDFQHAYSRFEDDSLISQLNEDKALEDAPDELVAMLQFALTYGEASQGLFNISTDAPLREIGYGGEATSGSFVPNWMQSIDISGNTIRLDDRLRIDLGGFGKGWLVDELFNMLLTTNAQEIFINGGGDIRLRESAPATLPLMHPTNTTQYYATVQATDGALATSSPLHRRWAKHNHLISEDGNSYRGDITSLSAWAPTARIADMAATTCLVSDSPFKIAEMLGVSCIATYTDDHFEASEDFPLSQT